MGTKDFDVPRSECPQCGYSCDAALGDENGLPEPGDFSVCAACSGVNIFGADMKLRRLTEDEEREAAKRPGLKLLVHAVIDLNEAKVRPWTKNPWWKFAELAPQNEGGNNDWN